MKPQKQLFRHKPSDGVYGDCHRTAIAIVLDLDAQDVPHFMDGGDGRNGDDAHDRVEAWLNARGISTITILYPGETPVQEILDTVAATNKRGRPAFILGGQSRNGVNHSVVCCDGEIFCDPSLNDSGIVGPCDDGFYWLTFFGHLDATADPNRRSVHSIANNRDDLENAALSLLTTLAGHGAPASVIKIAIGTGELHAHVPCSELHWAFPAPSKACGYPVEWHWGSTAEKAEAVA